MLPEPNTSPLSNAKSPIRFTDLPIEELREGIVSELSKGNRLIVEAPTGSGKSTQIPQMLLDAGLLGSGLSLIHI